MEGKIHFWFLVEDLDNFTLSIELAGGAGPTWSHPLLPDWRRTFFSKMKRINFAVWGQVFASQDT